MWTPACQQGVPCHLGSETLEAPSLLFGDPPRLLSPVCGQIPDSEHQLTVIFFFFICVLFCPVECLVPCIPHVLCVYLSPVPLVGCLPCLVPPLLPAFPSPLAPLGWAGSVQCQAAGHGAELLAPSSPPAPICLRFWLVLSSHVSLCTSLGLFCSQFLFLSHLHVLLLLSHCFPSSPFPPLPSSPSPEVLFFLYPSYSLPFFSYCPLLSHSHLLPPSQPSSSPSCMSQYPPPCMGLGLMLLALALPARNRV